MTSDWNGIELWMNGVHFAALYYYVNNAIQHVQQVIFVLHPSCFVSSVPDTSCKEESVNSGRLCVVMSWFVVVLFIEPACVPFCDVINCVSEIGGQYIAYKGYKYVVQGTVQVQYTSCTRYLYQRTRTYCTDVTVLLLYSKCIPQ
jgi:hypothetical protein